MDNSYSPLWVCQGQHCGLWDVLLATPTNIRITWPAESSYPTLRVCYLALLYVQISFAHISGYLHQGYFSFLSSYKCF